MGLSPRERARERTYLVWDLGPSAASTTRTMPSTVERMRSTSPAKSAWPGVSVLFQNYNGLLFVIWRMKLVFREMTSRYIVKKGNPNEFNTEIQRQRHCFNSSRTNNIDNHVLSIASSRVVIQPRHLRSNRNPSLFLQFA